MSQAIALQEPLTRENAVMIFIDLQAGPISTIHSMDQQELKNNAISLAKVGSILQLPVILAGADLQGAGGMFLPELIELLPHHVYVKHSTNNAWETPEFVVAVENTGRKKLIMAGIATDVGLLLPAVSAVAAGYGVYAIVDVSGTLNSRIEQAAWMRMMQAGVLLTSWTAFTGEVQRDYTKEAGKQLRAVIGERLQSQQGPFSGDESKGETQT